MLVIFRSKAAAEIFMYPEHAKMLLNLIGKPFEPEQAPRGVITVEQLPQALETLRAAAEKSAEEQKNLGAADDEDAEKPHPMALPVGLAQRAYPLISMLERAAKSAEVVTWGI